MVTVLVDAYIAGSDGTPAGNTAAIHLARDAAGLGGTLLFSDREYVTAANQASGVGQIWDCSSGGSLKTGDGLNVDLLTVSAAGVNLINGDLNGNRDQQTAGRGLVVLTGVERFAARKTRVHDTAQQGIFEYHGLDSLFDDVEVWNTGKTPTQSGNSGGVGILCLGSARARLWAPNVHDTLDAGISGGAGENTTGLYIHRPKVRRANWIGVAWGSGNSNFTTISPDVADCGGNAVDTGNVDGYLSDVQARNCNGGVIQDPSGLMTNQVKLVIQGVKVNGTTGAAVAGAGQGIAVCGNVEVSDFEVENCADEGVLVASGPNAGSTTDTALLNGFSRNNGKAGVKLYAAAGRPLTNIRIANVESYDDRAVPLQPEGLSCYAEAGATLDVIDLENFRHWGNTGLGVNRQAGPGAAPATFREVNTLAIAPAPVAPAAHLPIAIQARPASALTSPARLRAAVTPGGLNLATYSDAQLRRVIREATAAIQTYAGWPIVARAYTERRIGNATYTVRVANYPIISFTSISYQQPSGAGLVSVDTLGKDISIDFREGLIINATRWGFLDDSDPLYPSALFRLGSVYDLSYVGGYALSELASPASAGARSLAVLDPTGFVVGGWYRLSDDTAGDEEVQVTALSSTVLTLAAPLGASHTAGLLLHDPAPELVSAITVCERLAQDYLLGLDSPARQGLTSARQGSISVGYRADPFALSGRQMADLRGVMRRGMVLA